MGGLIGSVSDVVDGTIDVVQGGSGASLDVATGTIDFAGGGLTEIADSAGEATVNPILAGTGLDHLLGFDATASGGGEQSQNPDANPEQGETDLPVLALAAAGIVGIYLLTRGDL